MIRFLKMHGLGNDFVVLDGVEGVRIPSDLSARCQQVCDRRFGVGADGVVLVERETEAIFRMRMWNPDGTESEMCGNAVRCVAVMLKDRGHIADLSVSLQTGAGPLRLEILADGQVRVDMGLPKLRRGEIGMSGPAALPFVEQPIGNGFKGTAVSMGNPHLVIFVSNADEVDVPTLGPLFEHSPDFPQRTNVHFVQVLSRTALRQRTWERGAGQTLACGTGASASLVAAVLTDRADRAAKVTLPGGTLEMELNGEGHVLMTGPAVTVFEGELAEPS